MEDLKHTFAIGDRVAHAHGRYVSGVVTREPMQFDNRLNAVTKLHGSDSSSPGIAVFGMDPHKLIRCGCGNWKPPTEWQIAKMRRKIERIKKREGMS